ncbi:MAG: glycosyltransferase family 2 protein [Rubritalea sp.]
MDQKIDITIVSASYNYVDYIGEMLDSVASQKGVVFEHLIFDAGSTDGTIEIIQEYEHVELVVEPDKGMCDAINKGFKAARGKWVIWLNTDDRLKPGALAAFLEFAEQKPKADVIYGAWDFIDGKGDFMRTMQAIPFQKLMLSQLGCYIGSTSCFYRRSTTIDEGFVLNERFKYVMDGEYYNRLAHSGKKFQCYKQVLAEFRMHGSNLSQKHLKKKDVDGLMDQQLQFAESRAIRRAYGITLFKSDHLNCVADAVFFYYFKVVKIVLKLMSKPAK